MQIKRALSSCFLAGKINFTFKSSLLFLLLLFFLLPVQAKSEADSSAQQSKRFDFKLMPYVSYNRTLSYQLGVVPLLMYRLNSNDTISPQSISGGCVMYTGNKSLMGVQFNKFFFAEDRYRVIVAYGGGDLNGQTYMSLPFFSDFVDFNVDLFFFKAELQRRLVKNLYIGLNYTFARMNTQMDTTKLHGAEPELANLSGLGLTLSFDDRNSVYYPTAGHLVTFKYLSNPKFLGNDFVSDRIELDANKYIGMVDNRDVLAFRLYTGIALGNLSFNQQFVVGNNDVRGYTQGEFRGKQIGALQAEYRWNFSEKVGVTAFGGAAMVFNGDNKANNGKLLPGAGVGVRYNVFPKNHMNVGLDFAAGKGDWGINFKIGEAF